MKRFAIALAAALVLAGPAMAEDFTTSSLRLVCMSRDRAAQLYCKGYFTGVLDMTMMAGAYRDQLESPKDREILARTGGVCYGHNENVAVDAVVQIFLNWATQHPKEWSRLAPFGAIAAMREAWPCH
jgi:hypothetical protein